jgi:hypothetical protein
MVRDRMRTNATMRQATARSNTLAPDVPAMNIMHRVAKAAWNGRSRGSTDLASPLTGLTDANALVYSVPPEQRGITLSVMILVWRMNAHPHHHNPIK